MLKKMCNTSQWKNMYVIIVHGFRKSEDTSAGMARYDDTSSKSRTGVKKSRETALTILTTKNKEIFITRRRCNVSAILICERKLSLKDAIINSTLVKIIVTPVTVFIPPI